MDRIPNTPLTLVDTAEMQVIICIVYVRWTNIYDVFSREKDI